MAGTLTISTLSDGTNSTSSTNCIQGSAKAWVRFNNGTINASYNVSSVTRNGTGDYSINFTNALTDANYSTVGSVQNSTANYGWCFTPYYSAAPTTTVVRIATSTAGGAALADVAYCNVAVFR